MVVDNLAPIPNTMGIPSRAKYLVKIKSKKDLLEALDLAKTKKIPFVPIGQGCNILPKKYVNAVIGVMKIKGIKQRKNYFKVGAGVKWDDFVKITISRGYSGAEALSLIPGAVGACPVQNIGAYGTEVKDIIHAAETYDVKKKEFIQFNANKCEFGYRTSIFKKNPGRFVITSVAFRLKKGKSTIPEYKDIADYFKKRKNASPSAKQIRRAVISIRKKKLPDCKIIPNSGSYFINPFVRGKKNFAGWLIEEAGLKGKLIGKAKIFLANALILTNPKSAGFGEIMKAENKIIKKVRQKFGITLQREPVIIG